MSHRTSRTVKVLLTAVALSAAAFTALGVASATQQPSTSTVVAGNSWSRGTTIGSTDRSSWSRGTTTGSTDRSSWSRGGTDAGTGSVDQT